jgi:hypothetical protein
MLIDRLILFLQEAAQLPFELWKPNYLMAKKAFIRDLTQIQSNINQDDNAAKKLGSFITLLHEENPDELRLAEGFELLSAIFRSSRIVNKKIENYQQLSLQFLKRVQKEKMYLERTEDLKNSLSPEKQSAFDKRLFNNEGLSYCLLYYMVYFKTLSDLKSDKEKNEFFRKTSVNLGFGGLPGIQQDFAADEALDKFILLILDDETRTALKREYYICKQTILKAESFKEVEYALHEFIFHILYFADKNGVEKAADSFFKPYGKDATVSEVLSLFKTRYAPGNK